ncbi:peptidoglycan DD-metalloendopeptidase family protein [Aeromicrobium sp.]|uniref:peptidoglycan DD-metalloendopeptidase family protein n=1 Tax=Aeromicrobium sp. TaxID=1871063 RepID=UPI003D6AB5A5
MPLVRVLIVLLVVAIALGSPARAGDGSWAWPVGDRRVTGGFDLPDNQYSPGHRGIDLPGRVGEPVRAVASGRVTFAGSVAGVGVVTIDHGDERSTYQPVDATVDRDDTVEAGDVVGSLLDLGSHCATACLHLGRLEGDSYLDPTDRLGSTSLVRLVDPAGPVPKPPVGPSGDGTFRRPVGGPMTSPFGPRVHPLTGVRKLHDGTDFGVPCGTPVRAAGDGTVVGRDHSGAYGIRVTVRHAGGLETSYNHLSSHAVAVGQRVTTSTVLGHVGSTGSSTGCHLHLMVRRDGRPTDPMTLL